MHEVYHYRQKGIQYSNLMNFHLKLLCQVIGLHLNEIHKKEGYRINNSIIKRVNICMKSITTAMP